MLNEQGIRAVKSIIRTRANKVIFLSKLSEDIVRMFGFEAAKNAARIEATLAAVGEFVDEPEAAELADVGETL